MTTLQIDSKRMKEAAEKCPEVKKFCKIMWPEEFEPQWVDVTGKCEFTYEGSWLRIFHGDRIGVIYIGGPRIFDHHREEYRIEENTDPVEGEGGYPFRILKRK